MYERDDQGQQTDEERHERKNLDNRHATIPPFAESVGSELQKVPSRHLLHSMSQGQVSKGQPPAFLDSA